MVYPLLAMLSNKADTVLLFIYSQPQRNGITTPVAIDIEDADAVVFCAYASSKYDCIERKKRKETIVDC